MVLVRRVSGNNDFRDLFQIGVCADEVDRMQELSNLSSLVTERSLMLMDLNALVRSHGMEPCDLSVRCYWRHDGEVSRCSWDALKEHALCLMRNVGCVWLVASLDEEEPAVAMTIDATCGGC